MRAGFSGLRRRQPATQHGALQLETGCGSVATRSLGSKHLSAELIERAPVPAPPRSRSRGAGATRPALAPAMKNPRVVLSTVLSTNVRINERAEGDGMPSYEPTNSASMAPSLPLAIVALVPLAQVTCSVGSTVHTHVYASQPLHRRPAARGRASVTRREKLIGGTGFMCINTRLAPASLRACSRSVDA